MNQIIKITLEYLIVFIMIFLLGLIMSTGKKKKITKNNMPITTPFFFISYNTLLITLSYTLYYTTKIKKINCITTIYYNN